MDRKTWKRKNRVRASTSKSPQLSEAIPSKRNIQDDYGSEATLDEPTWKRHNGRVHGLVDECISSSTAKTEASGKWIFSKLPLYIVNSLIWVSRITHTPGTRDERHTLLLRGRLDRACANLDWFDFFPSSHVRHLFCHKSDHALIFVQMTG
ncbi:hypothetical protein ACH5RR_003549 [Cinchona calisaya]|uniref:Reverse transcriptase n=1 Tax=Cinchona calisaya TaxID=153742 RepID=A0ABD3AV45_9GENT